MKNYSFYLLVLLFSIQETTPAELQLDVLETESNDGFDDDTNFVQLQNDDGNFGVETFEFEDETPEPEDTKLAVVAATLPRSSLKKTQGPKKTVTFDETGLPTVKEFADRNPLVTQTEQIKKKVNRKTGKVTTQIIGRKLKFPDDQLPADTSIDTALMENIFIYPNEEKRLDPYLMEKYKARNEINQIIENFLNYALDESLDFSNPEVSKSFKQKLSLMQQSFFASQKYATGVDPIPSYGAIINEALLLNGLEPSKLKDYDAKTIQNAFRNYSDLIHVYSSKKRDEIEHGKTINRIINRLLNWALDEKWNFEKKEDQKQFTKEFKTKKTSGYPELRYETVINDIFLNASLDISKEYDAQTIQDAFRKFKLLFDTFLEKNPSSKADTDALFEKYYR